MLNSLHKQICNQEQLNHGNYYAGTNKNKMTKLQYHMPQTPGTSRVEDVV
jgi:hypothetical protein